MSDLHSITLADKLTDCEKCHSSIYPALFIVDGVYLCHNCAPPNTAKLILDADRRRPVKM